MSKCYDFDEYVDRKNSHAEKWNNMIAAGAPKMIIQSYLCLLLIWNLNVVMKF